MVLLRAQVREKLLRLRVGSGLRRQFDRFDTANRGSLDVHQLRQALLYLGVDLTSQELRALFDKLDSNASGRIRCVLFLA